MQEALTPEFEDRCGYSGCAAVVIQGGRKKQYCSEPCARKARQMRERERCKDLTSKKCRGCDEDKPISEYRHPWMLNCQSCMQERRRRQYERQGGKDYIYAQMLVHRYGITMQQYQERLTAQGGRCAICGNPPKEGLRLDVDHCHATGVVRDLLCRACNNALGNAGDDLDRLRKMVAYLERHTARQSDPSESA